MSGYLYRLAHGSILPVGERFHVFNEIAAHQYLLRGGGILGEVLSFYDRDFQYVQVIVSYVVEVGDVE